MVREVWQAPVRYGECDQQGIAFNAHYLAWCDEAGSAWFAAVGTPYDVLLERGLDVHVKASALDWSAPARYGDVVVVDAGVDRVGQSSFTLLLVVRVGNRTCCDVRLTYVLVDTGGRPTRVPDDLRTTWLGTREPV